MKIRYYLRGLGLGILITSIFFLVSNNGAARTMSDEQIKARAKELGMIENKVLAEMSAEEIKTEETVVEEEATKAVETSEEPMEATAEETVEATIEKTAEETTEVATEEEPHEDGQPEETSTEEPESVEEPESIEEQKNAAPNTEPVTIVVNRGEGSDTVSRRLQEAGLVADAYEYDRYLMANGYDKRIGAGQHVIPAGATWEEIAKELCN